MDFLFLLVQYVIWLAKKVTFLYKVGSSENAECGV